MSIREVDRDRLLRFGVRDRDLDRDFERDLRLGDSDSDFRERRRDRERRGDRDRERSLSRLSRTSSFLRTVISLPLRSWPSNFLIASFTSEDDSKQTSPLFLPLRSCASV